MAKGENRIYPQNLELKEVLVMISVHTNRILRRYTYLAGVVVLCFGNGARALESRQLEYRVKAGFLCNFAKFVEWPDEVGPESLGYINIGILGENPFAKIFESTIRDVTVKGLKFRITNIQDIADADFCHILFVCNSERRQAKAILEQLRDIPTLTVGESKGFSKSGGIINFILRDGKIRFQINEDAANNVGLKISSKLLKLAEIVESRN